MATTGRLPKGWNFWLVLLTHGPGGKPQWQIEDIVAFFTLDLFFREYNRLPPPKELRDIPGKRPSIACFITGIKPAWEDEKNKNGGACCLLVDEDQVNDVWKDLLFYAVGGTLNTGCGFKEPEQEVTGLIVGPKRQNREWGIEIWTSKTNIDLPQIQQFLAALPSAPRRVNDATFKPHHRS
jgi:hypothetical protein